MTRLIETPIEQMTDAQRKLYEKIASGPREACEARFWHGSKVRLISKN